MRKSNVLNKDDWNYVADFLMVGNYKKEINNKLGLILRKKIPNKDVNDYIISCLNVLRRSKNKIHSYLSKTFTE